MDPDWRIRQVGAPVSPAIALANPCPAFFAGGGAASVGEALGEGVQQLGENLVVRRACVLRAPAAGGVLLLGSCERTRRRGR